jgi:hypothetical protein
MFGRFRHLVAATIGFLGVATGVCASSGYLPTVGPEPLRFRTVPTPATNAPVFSTPAPPEPPSAPVSFLDLPPLGAVQPVTTEQAPAQPIALPSKPMISEGYSAEAHSPDPEPVVPAATPNAVISPEMLVKYFTQPAGTNSAAGGSGPSVGFTPPAATPTPTPPGRATP